jgi:hypothetical protein
LIHAAYAGVFHDELFGDKVPLAECDHEMATFSATSTDRNIGMIVQHDEDITWAAHVRTGDLCF